jgi:primosomal protein N' (replication factor Y)
MRVLVPVGSRKITGIVTELCRESGREEVKDILDLLDERPIFPPDLIRLWQWAAAYYVASPNEVLSTILPGGLRIESERVVRLRRDRDSRQRQEGGRRSPSDSSVPSGSGLVPQPKEEGLSKPEQEVLAFLAQRKPTTTRILRRRFPSFHLTEVLGRLEERGFITVQERLPGYRTRYLRDTATSSVVGEEPAQYRLSGAQESVLAQILSSLAKPSFTTFLLHGVTGSGKTEVYLQAAEVAVKQGKGVLILVPEIALTHQLIEQVRARFGARVALLHSGLVGTERWEAWWQIVRGETPVVVGARSAIFAPFPSLGLIVVDEEHDPAYKQEEGVRYNARDLAVMRGKLSSCPVILGSATPSMESYFHSRRRRYTLLELPERVEEKQLPQVEIIDLRAETRGRENNKQRFYSISLSEALKRNFATGGQSLLFLNRRGYANYLQCYLCGFVLSCPNCSVTLTFHLHGRGLRCHYCGFSQNAPDLCPQCRGASLESLGVGTEQVEEALRRLIPEARVARLDRDTTSRRGTLAHLLSAWRKNEIDVLVGTQMVTKGHDIPGVTLVGVLLADVSLNLPDFRAAERTFQLLTQVAGRAGRGRENGRVIIQTYRPQHYSVHLAASHDFPRFAARELHYREALSYPPFIRMVNIRLEGLDQDRVKSLAEYLAQALRSLCQEQKEAPVLLGPAPAPVERLKGRYRWHLLLKSRESHTLHTLVRKGKEMILPRAKAQGIRVIVDVDPYSML